MKARNEYVGLMLVIGILFLAGCASNQPTETTTTEPVVTTTEPSTTTTTSTTSTTTTSTTTTSTSTTTTIPATTYIVNITDTVFEPVDLKIHKGDTVVWVNKDRSPHTVTSEYGTELASDPIPEARNFSHTFDTVGNYAYHCKYYATKMNARIVVIEPATSKTKTTTNSGTTTTKMRPVSY